MTVRVKRLSEATVMESKKCVGVMLLCVSVGVTRLGFVQVMRAFWVAPQPPFFIIVLLFVGDFVFLAPLLRRARPPPLLLGANVCSSSSSFFSSAIAIELVSVSVLLLLVRRLGSSPFGFGFFAGGCLLLLLSMVSDLDSEVGYCWLSTDKICGRNCQNERYSLCQPR